MLSVNGRRKASRDYWLQSTQDPSSPPRSPPRAFGDYSHDNFAEADDEGSQVGDEADQKLEEVKVAPGHGHRRSPMSSISRTYSTTHSGVIASNAMIPCPQPSPQSSVSSDSSTTTSTCSAPSQSPTSTSTVSTSASLNARMMSLPVKMITMEADKSGDADGHPGTEESKPAHADGDGEFEADAAVSSSSGLLVDLRQHHHSLDEHAPMLCLPLDGPLPDSKPTGVSSNNNTTSIIAESGVNHRRAQSASTDMRERAKQSAAVVVSADSSPQGTPQSTTRYLGFWKPVVQVVQSTPSQASNSNAGAFSVPMKSRSLMRSGPDLMRVRDGDYRQFVSGRADDRHLNAQARLRGEHDGVIRTEPARLRSLSEASNEASNDKSQDTLTSSSPKPSSPPPSLQHTFKPSPLLVSRQWKRTDATQRLLMLQSQDKDVQRRRQSSVKHAEQPVATSSHASSQPADDGPQPPKSMTLSPSHPADDTEPMFPFDEADSEADALSSSPLTSASSSLTASLQARSENHALTSPILSHYSRNAVITESPPHLRLSPPAVTLQPGSLVEMQLPHGVIPYSQQQLLEQSYISRSAYSSPVRPQPRRLPLSASRTNRTMSDQTRESPSYSSPFAAKSKSATGSPDKPAYRRQLVFRSPEMDQHHQTSPYQQPQPPGCFLQSSPQHQPQQQQQQSPTISHGNGKENVSTGLRRAKSYLHSLDRQGGDDEGGDDRVSSQAATASSSSRFHSTPSSPSTSPRQSPHHRSSSNSSIFLPSHGNFSRLTPQTSPSHQPASIFSHPSLRHLTFSQRAELNQMTPNTRLRTIKQTVGVFEMDMEI